MISETAIREAIRTVSTDGAFFYSARNLMYELVRREALAGPMPAKEFRAVVGRRDGLVSALAAKRAAVHTALPDVFDYSVRRVLVFDRLDTCLVFAKNGFHRKIEIALVTWPDFPAHVWSRVTKQVEGGLRTAFYTAHDANKRGARLKSRVRKLIRGHGRAHFADVGLTFAQAFAAGIPVRQKTVAKSESVETSEHEALMLATGNYAHLEELIPLELMRWAYTRIARGPEDPGFG